MREKVPRRWSKPVVIGASSGSSSVMGVPVAASGGSAAAPGVLATAVGASTGVSSAMASNAVVSNAVASNAAVSTAVVSSAMASSSVAAGGSEPPASSVRVASARALVVDDDPEVRRALARLLRPELDVHLAGSVAEARAILARLDRVDVAFVDWELPDGTGEQILERLAAWPDAIRVLISARVSSTTDGAGIASGNPLKNRALANLVLGKPVARGVVEALKCAALALPHG